MSSPETLGNDGEGGNGEFLTVEDDEDGESTKGWSVG
jgi:hypothetical protein